MKGALPRLIVSLLVCHVSTAEDWVINPSGITGSERPTSIAFGNARFVMGTEARVGNTLINSIAWSSDGETWTPAEQVFSGSVKVVFFDRFFYAILGQSVHRSFDGENWEFVTSTGTLPNVAKLVANSAAIVGSSGNTNFSQVQMTADGDNWSLHELPKPEGHTRAYGANLAVGGGYFWNSYQTSTSSLTTQLARSIDGITWETLTSPWPVGFDTKIAYGNGKLVLVSNSEIAISSDRGESFDLIPQPTEARHGILFAGQRFFASATLAWSTDAENWTDPEYSDQLHAFVDIAYGNGRYVAVGRYTGRPNPGTDLIAIWETEAAPEIPHQPSSKTGITGRSVTFGRPTPTSFFDTKRYQWFHDGQAIPDERGTKLVLENLSAANAGRYHYVVTENGLSVSSESARLEVVDPGSAGRLVNLSVRAQSGQGDNTFIVGYVLGGGEDSETTSLLVRGVGPALSDYGVTDALSDPKLAIYSPHTEPMKFDDWGGTAQLKATFERLGAFSFPRDLSTDAAVLLSSQQAGTYTVHATGPTGEIGSVLTEIYDASDGVNVSRPRLINLSCRTALPSYNGELNVGFVIEGETPMRLLIRSIGPSLKAYGVSNFHFNPYFDLYVQENGQPRRIDQASTSYYADETTAIRVGAFPLNSISELDAVLERELDPGVYSVVIKNQGIDERVVLVEIYEVP